MVVLHFDSYHYTDRTGSNVVNGSESNDIRRPARRACLPAAAIMAALSVQRRSEGILN
jgi:hypothetical protein